MNKSLCFLSLMMLSSSVCVKSEQTDFFNQVPHFFEAVVGHALHETHKKNGPFSFVFTNDSNYELTLKAKSLTKEVKAMLINGKDSVTIQPDEQLKITVTALVEFNQQETNTCFTLVLPEATMFEIEHQKADSKDKITRKFTFKNKVFDCVYHYTKGDRGYFSKEVFQDSKE